MLALKASRGYLSQLRASFGEHVSTCISSPPLPFPISTSMCNTEMELEISEVRRGSDVHIVQFASFWVVRKSMPSPRPCFSSPASRPLISFSEGPIPPIETVFSSTFWQLLCKCTSIHRFHLTSSIRRLLTYPLLDHCSSSLLSLPSGSLHRKRLIYVLYLSRHRISVPRSCSRVYPYRTGYVIHLPNLLLFYSEYSTLIKYMRFTIEISRHCTTRCSFFRGESHCDRPPRNCCSRVRFGV